MSPPLLSNSLALYGRLYQYLRAYWKSFLLSLLAMMISAATEPALGYLMKPLIDEGFLAKDQATFFWVPVAIIVLFTVRGITGYTNEYVTSWLTGHLVQRLREDMFTRLLHLPSSYFENHSSGRLLSRLAHDVNQVTDAGFNVITVSVKDGLTTLALLGMLFYLDWQLALISLLVFPAVALCIQVINRRLRSLSRQIQIYVAQLLQVVGESIEGQRVIKVYQGQQYEAKRLAGAARAIRHNVTKQTAASSLNTGITQLIIAIALALVLYFAAWRAKHDVLTAGAFMAFIANMAALLAPVKRITNISQSLQRGLAAAESVFHFLDERFEEDTGQRVLERTRGALTFDRVSFCYPQTKNFVLQDVSLEILPGETVALVGASGSGKTTLINLVPRFYLPTTGEVRLDGVPINELTLVNVRQHIALVSQEVVLFNDTIAANIAYGKVDQISSEAIIDAARQANALEFIEMLPDGFDTVVGEKGVRLSGGQRQRLAIARALLKNAPILLLDEATSALDTQSERLVQAALESLMKNRTTIVVAHRLSTIEHADRIIVMHHGKIVELGTHSELLAAEGRYTNLYRLQFLASSV